MKKSDKIEVCCTPEQKARIHKKAGSLGISASEYLLFTGLNVEILCQVGADTFAAELNILEIKMKQGLLTRQQFQDMASILIEKQKKLGVKP